MTELIKKERQSNFELMRIFAMFLIVMHHLCQHGLWFAPDALATTNYYVAKILFCWTGQLGNLLFILASGYFIFAGMQKIYLWSSVVCVIL